MILKKLGFWGLTLLVIICSAKSQTWKKIEMVFPQGDTLLDDATIRFASKNVGWIVTRGYTVQGFPSSGYMTKIFKTSDGGKHWQHQKTLDSTRYIYSMFSIDSLHCWAFDGKGFILYTINGGVTWDSVSIEYKEWEINSSIVFFDLKKGFLIGNYVRQTTDGGRTWSKLGDTTKDYPAPRDVYFVSENLGWAVHSISRTSSDVGYISNTTDGGVTWNDQATKTALLFAVDFVDSLRGYAVGTNLSFSNGYYYYTVDSGKNWFYTRQDNVGSFNDVGFLNNTIGWIAGVGGKIWRTTNGGGDWIVENTGTDATIGKIQIFKNEKIAYAFGGKPLVNNAYQSPFVLLCTDLDSVLKVRDQNTDSFSGYSLSQNFPNPFNPSTSIEYKIPESNLVTIKIYDILGREVQTLVNEIKNQGIYSIKWECLEFNTGVYLVRLNAGGFVQTRKIILLR